MNLYYEMHQLKTAFYNFSNYCYIIMDKTTKAALIVDPAWELEKVTDKLCQLDARLVSILLTHSHYDHVNLVNPLIKRFNPDVYMSKAEIDYYGFRCNNLHGLDDMDEISAGRTKLLCMLTPGHTAGGMSYLLPDSLFTGDTIFTEGCGMCSKKGGSAEKLFYSIQKVKATVAPDVRIYPGHSFGEAPGHTLETLKRDNIYFQFEKKEFFVEFRMRENQKGIFDFK